MQLVHPWKYLPRKWITLRKMMMPLTNFTEAKVHCTQFKKIRICTGANSCNLVDDLAFCMWTRCFWFTSVAHLSNFWAGTCAMKPCEQGEVDDGRLNVYGVRNLKIAGNHPTSFAKTWYIFEPFFFRLQMGEMALSIRSTNELWRRKASCVCILGPGRMRKTLSHFLMIWHLGNRRDSALSLK